MDILPQIDQAEWTKEGNPPENKELSVLLYDTGNARISLLLF